MQAVKSVRDAQVNGKRVLLRVDFNVPLQDGVVADDRRIKAAVPTIKLLIEEGARKIIVLTHIGRPGGKVVEGLRVAPVAKKLREQVNTANIEFHENLRFDAREENNDQSFAAELAALGDVYINEAFADSHRAHASITGVPKLLPCYAGLHFIEEVKKLSSALTPPKGAIAIIGGAKGDTKIPLIEKFSELYNKVLIGGAIANEYTPKKTNIVLPTDGVPQLKDMLDIGPQTAQAWSAEIAKTPFVVWNGPVGMYEKEEYGAGTDALAKAIAEGSCKAVTGGGDTAAALAKFSFDPARVFISTGGGAMLEFLANGTLPGIEALRHQ